MTTPSPPPGEDAALRQTLRDVLGLMALPAIWRSKPPSELLVTLAQALEAVIDFECVFAVTSGASPAVVCRRTPSGDDALSVRARAWFGPCLRSTSLVQRLRCGELGELMVVSEPLGYGGARGHVVVASGAPGFPSARELVVIKTASSLLTNALDTAAALEEREEALRAKDDFLALLGHELRNPLAPIVTALDLMQQRAAGGESREEQVMRRQVEHLRRLVDDLLDASRVARNVLALQKVPVRVADVLVEAIEATAPVLKEYEHALTVRMPPADAFVDADPVRLSQAVGNLLMNAAKYTPRAGRIFLEAEPRAEQIAIVVRDDGIGIEPALLPRIFDKFVQGKRHADRRHGGLGIGLSLVRTLVEMHGGSVSVQSEGSGKGAEFLVLLPLSSEQAVSSRASAVAPAPAAEERRRVLVVDDNADAAEMLVAGLEAAGFEAHMLTDPLAALDAIERLEPDLGVLDIGMPGMDGYELCGHIRRRFPGRKLPLIALTGYGSDSDRQRALTAGFDVHCAKPISLSALVERARALLS